MRALRQSAISCGAGNNLWQGASPAADIASLPTALAGWLESSAQVRAALGGLTEKRVDSGRK